MKTFKEFLNEESLNENKTQQINKAAKEVHDFLFSGSKAIDMENFIDSVLKDHKLSRSERKMVIARVKNFHGYTGSALDKLLNEAEKSEYTAGYEESQFGGYRAQVRNRSGKVSYLGGAAYKTPEAAKGEAEVYIDVYVTSSGNDRMTTSAVSRYRKRNKNDLY